MTPASALWLQQEFFYAEDGLKEQTAKPADEAVGTRLLDRLAAIAEDVLFESEQIA